MSNAPLYVDLPGDCAYAPPFMQQDCAARLFLLPADPAALQGAVDQWLNIGINDIFEYKAMPFITLTTMSIAKTYCMCDESAGYSEEQDVGFCMSLAAYRKGSGALPVVDHFAIAFPFLLVQNPLPLLTGRDVYGFRKMLADYVYLPNTQIPIAASSTVVTSPGALSQPMEILRIDDLIDDLALAPGHSLLSRLEHLAASELEKVQSALQQLFDKMQVDLMKFLLSQSADLRALFKEFLRVLRDHRQIDVVFLRQLRALADPTRAAYQAIVESPMRIDSISPLTPLPIPTVRLSDYPSYPLMTNLGLQETVTPLAAFQVNLSFEQGKGRVIAEGGEGGM